jgi:hypothetical protein
MSTTHAPARTVRRAASRRWTWSALAIWGAIPPLAGLGLYRLEPLYGSTADAFGRALAALVVFALTALAARRISVLQSHDLNLRERAHGGPLRQRAALAAPRRWALWLATISMALAAAYVLLATDADHTSELFSMNPLDLAVLMIGAAIVMPYISDLGAGAITRRSPFATRSPVRSFVQEPNVMGAITRMSPTLLLFIVLAGGEYVATWVVGVREPLKLLGGLGFVAMTAAGVLASPTILASYSSDLEPRWRSRWYPVQLRAADRVRRAVLMVRATLRALQVVSLGLFLGAPSAFTDEQVGGLSLTYLLTALTAHGLTRILWVWSPSEAGSPPIETGVLKEYEQPMLKAAAVALAAGSVASLTAILLA